MAMAFISLIIPTVKAYLEKRISLLQLESKGHKVFCMVLWGLIVLGVFFGLDGLYEYYNAVYVPIIAKVYMSFTFFGLALGGSIVYWIFITISKMFSKRSNSSKELASIEEYAKNALKVIESEGVGLVKQHPVASILIGLSIGLLSGTMTHSKQ
jgi:hypothetical protein